MKLNIRKEESKDHEEVFLLIKNAFEEEVYSDHKEQFLVERLRKSESFVPELALVAEMDKRIVGYILLTKIKIISPDCQETESLALAPVAVLKEYQGKGIGGRLIQKAHDIARNLKFKSVILIGHEKYYPKLGYEMTKSYGIKLPFDVPDENCMLIELTKNALKNIHGVVEYPKAFFE